MLSHLNSGVNYLLDFDICVIFTPSHFIFFIKLKSAEELLTYEAMIM